jgi:DNA-binding SARP family transcriptional activator
MELPTLTLSLLGGFELRCGAEPVPIHSARIRSLLAWLALHADRLQPRERAASALWPDSRDSQARTNLRNLIHGLRRTFPEIVRYLELEGPAIGWLPGAPVRVDVVEFRQALAQCGDVADDSAARERLERALALYHGPLLPDAFDEWLAPEQDRVERLRAAGLDRLRDGDGAREAAAVEPSTRLRVRFRWSAMRTGCPGSQSSRSDPAAFVRMIDRHPAAAAVRTLWTTADTGLPS